MSDSRSEPRLTANDRQRLVEIVDRFLQSRDNESPPSLEESLPEDDPLRSAVLIELVHADLVRRLNAGQAARVEEYLRRFPELQQDTEIVKHLIWTEYKLRVQRKPDLLPNEYRRRFPEYAKDVWDLFQRHMSSGNGLSIPPQESPPEFSSSTVNSPPQNSQNSEKTVKPVQRYESSIEKSAVRFPLSRTRPGSLVVGVIATLTTLLLLVAVAIATLGYLRGSTALQREVEQRQEAEQREEEARLALEEEWEADEEQQAYVERLEWQLYLCHIALAQHELNDGDIAAAADYLDDCPEDYRHWEWAHLTKRCDAEPLTLAGHTSAVNDVAFTAGSGRLASASDDGTVKIWDPATGQETLTLTGHSGAVRCVAFSTDGKLIVSGGEGKDRTGEIRIWNTSTGQEVRAITGLTSPVRSVAFSPDGKLIVSGGGKEADGLAPAAGELKIWDAGTGQERFNLVGHLDVVTSVGFSPDGTRIVSASRDKSAKVWDASTGSQTLMLLGHEGGVSSVTFTPDGDWIATTGDDETVRFWDAEDGEEDFVLSVPQVSFVTFTPEGERIVTGGSDYTVRLWDGPTGDQTLELEGHTDAVNSLAFSRDGRRIASGSSDGTVRIWEALLDE